MTDTYGAKHKHLMLCATRKFKLFNSLYHSVYLVFATRSFYIANMFAVRYLWTTYVTKHRGQVTTGRRACKQNRSSRQSRYVVTAKSHRHCSK